MKITILILLLANDVRFAYFLSCYYGYTIQGTSMSLKSDANTMCGIYESNIQIEGNPSDNLLHQFAVKFKDEFNVKKEYYMTISSISVNNYGSAIKPNVCPEWSKTSFEDYKAFFENCQTIQETNSFISVSSTTSSKVCFCLTNNCNLDFETCQSKNLKKNF